MCGIWGGSPRLLRRDAAFLLHHRGPDQQAEVDLSSTCSGMPFILGQTRLNIVDRSDVPLPFTHEGAYICFNGEVYNWRELRRELLLKGVHFQTETDIEVVLHAFLHWGPSCLDRFNGMFAFGIWNNGKLFLARDRIGKKPLFYKKENGELAFSSELKVFESLEYDPIPMCESLEFYFDEMTPFRHVTSLQPGCSLVFEPETGYAYHNRWWRFPEYDGTVQDPEEAVDEFLALFQDACRLRLAADAKVTMFLSGGIDSSLIQAVVNLDTTFTCQFSEYLDTINEVDFVHEFAGRLGFTTRIISPAVCDLLFDLPELAYHIEIPVGSFSVFPIYKLAQAAHDTGYKVVLSGEGADELFNGYYRNELLLREDEMVQQELQGDYKQLASGYFGTSLDRFCKIMSRNGIGMPNETTRCIGQKWSKHPTTPFAHNIALAETTVFLQPLLAMADRMSMAHSLEVRNPFLDYRIIDFSTKLAPQLRFRNGKGKWILREALRRLVGDDLRIVHRKTKHGLPTPFNVWITGKNSFDRRLWNHILLQECLAQLGLRGNCDDVKLDSRSMLPHRELVVLGAPNCDRQQAFAVKDSQNPQSSTDGKGNSWQDEAELTLDSGFWRSTAYEASRVLRRESPNAQTGDQSRSAKLASYAMAFDPDRSL